MPRRHAALALIVAVCWAVNFVVIDIGLESFPPLLFAALRFGLTAFPAILLVPRPDVRWPAVVAVGLFICVGQFGLLFVAMNTGLPAGLASVIAPLQPVFTIPLAAVALGERPSLRQVAGVSLAVAGIGVIAAGRARGVPLQAVALGIASAASWGCGNVVTRAAGTKRPFSLLVWSSVVAPVPLLGLSLLFEGSARWQSAAASIDASGVAALGYVVIVSTFFGYGVWYRLMSRHPASTVAPFTLLVPVVGIFTAWLVRGEDPTWGEVLGSLVVLVGLTLALGLADVFAVRRRAADAGRPTPAVDGCSDRGRGHSWQRHGVIDDAAARYRQVDEPGAGDDRSNVDVVREVRRGELSDSAGGRRLCKEAHECRRQPDAPPGGIDGYSNLGSPGLIGDRLVAGDGDSPAGPECDERKSAGVVELDQVSDGSTVGRCGTA